MKVCPTCDKVYTDEDINFCLADGTTLLKKRGKAAKHSHWNDVVAIIFAAVAVLVFLCLVTSSPDDRSLISTGAGLPSTRNWIGVVGANIAAVCLSAFGWTAYLIPVLIMLAAWRVYQASSLVPKPFRVLGFVFFVVSLAGVVSLLGGYGAIVGEAAAQGTAHFLGTVGAGILLAAIFFSSLVLITNLTLAGFLSHFDVAWENVRIRIDEMREKRRDARSDVIDDAKKRAQKRRKMREEHVEEPIPPTISVGEVEALAMGAAVGRSVPLFDEEPSIPTIDAPSYQTVKVAEEESAAVVKAAKEKPE